MTCETCRDKDRRIAQLERDLEEAAQSATHFCNKWLQEKEQKRK